MDWIQPNRERDLLWDQSVNSRTIVACTELNLFHHIKQRVWWCACVCVCASIVVPYNALHIDIEINCNRNTCVCYGASAAACFQIVHSILSLFIVIIDWWWFLIFIVRKCGHLVLQKTFDPIHFVFYSFIV